MLGDRCRALEVSLLTSCDFAGADPLATVRRLLQTMSVKQGIKFDSINSVAEIKLFIQFHNLDMSEVLDPLSSFSEQPLPHSAYLD